MQHECAQYKITSKSYSIRIQAGKVPSKKKGNVCNSGILFFNVKVYEIKKKIK
jgi:hypothetical protein